MDRDSHSPTAPPRRHLLEILHREPHWYACRTRARAEKQVDRMLAEAGYETYLPLVSTPRQWSDRTKHVALPLFSGYTFVRFRLADFLSVTQTVGLVHVVGGRSAPAPVREEELEAVRCFVRGVEGTGKLPETVVWWEPGTPVVVLDGPFQGMRGFLLEVRAPTTRVAVRLTAIRMAVCVELPRSSLRRVA